jgi:hypothetical protein
MDKNELRCKSFRPCSPKFPWREKLKIKDFERHLIFQEKKETYGDEKDSLNRKLRSFFSTTARDYQPLLRVLDLDEIECGSS